MISVYVSHAVRTGILLTPLLIVSYTHSFMASISLRKWSGKIALSPLLDSRRCSGMSASNSV